MGVKELLGAASAVVFQSLFFWIHFHKDSEAAYTGCTSSSHSFNPCFSGFTSTSNIRRLLAAFQSLFFWIHCPRSQAFFKRSRLASFNPCFSGFTSTRRIIDRRLKMGRPRCFNPCFSGFTSTSGHRVTLRQSLLAAPGFNPCFSGFTSTSNRRSKRWVKARGHQPCFNPCFSGFTSTRSFQGKCRIHLALVAPLVSILVFLDSLPQEGTITKARKLCLKGF